MVIKVQLLQGLGQHLAEMTIYIPDEAGIETFQKALKLVKEESQKAEKKRSEKPPKK